MKNIDNEIDSIKRKILINRKLITTLDTSSEKTTQLIEILENEITALQRKITILEEKKNTGIYISKQPKLGDDRYKDFSHKESLDILRVLYYEFFQKDPSLSFVKTEAMFGDDTLRIIASTYLIRGEIPFQLLLTTNYKDYEPINDYSIGIKFNRSYLSKENAAKYLSLMSTLVNRYSNNEINFILGDALNKNCTLAYIGDNDFHHTSTQEKMYYEFFNLLCDNLCRNIIYIGDTMKQNAPPKEVKQVNTEIITPHIEAIAQSLGITTQSLIVQNKELKKKVLSLCRNSNN